MTNKKVVLVGELLLRLSTDYGCLIQNSSSFQAHYGGSEANVAISLAQFGKKAQLVSVLPTNDLGKGVKKHLLAHEVDCSQVLEKDGRLGTYYVESGTSVRSAKVIYDRQDSVFIKSQLSDWDWSSILKDTSILHISGITPALTEEWQEMTLSIVKEAKNRGISVSFDMNYRVKLWSQKEASQFLMKLLPFVDYCSMGKMDALYLLNIPKCKESLTTEEELIYYYQQMQTKFPNISVFYSTIREVYSASDNNLTGTLWMNQQLFMSKTYEITNIVDRVGGGDAFTSGVLYGLLEDLTPQEIIDYATAVSTLKHTIAGDACMFSDKTVRDFIASGSSKIVR